jgi:autotransporter-associated beta strand protein
MKIRNITALTVVAATLASASMHGTIILEDNYNVVSNKTGFVLGEGVNSGIIPTNVPPITRLTGSAAAGLSYYRSSGSKTNTAHAISADKFRIARVADSSTISFTPGQGHYDFASALNTLAATPENPCVYEMEVKVANGANGTQRCAFALSSVTGTANAWDFAVQLYRPAGAINYTVQKRASAASSDLEGTTTLNEAIVGEVGTYPNELHFLLRVTDAGQESVPSTNSWIEVATIIGGTTNWIYDTRNDTVGLPEGWRFAGASRYIYFDAAGNAGPVTFDDFKLTFISGPTAGPRMWTGGGSDDNWSTAANWGGVAPSSGDMLIFDGTTRQANINDITGLNVPWVKFNNGGFALTGNDFNLGISITNLGGNNSIDNNITFNSASTKAWHLTSGGELLLTKSVGADVNGEHHIVGGGTLRSTSSFTIGPSLNPAFVIDEGQHIVDGGTFTSRGGYRIASLSAGTGGRTLLTNNATMSFTAAGGNFRVGDSANPNTARLDTHNSSLTMTGGSLGIPYATGATGVVNQVGGTVAGGIVAFSDAGAGTGTYSIKDGTLEPLQIREDTASGISAIYFDNATLRPASGASNTFFIGVDLAEIQSGSLTVDATSNLTIEQVLTGTGSLTKTGSGTLTLTGANIYSGSTIIQNGKLVLPTTHTNGNTTVQVGGGTELAVPLTTFDSTLQVGGLTFDGGTLTFDWGSFVTPSGPLIRASNLSVNAQVTVNIANGLELNVGRVVLIDYDGTLAGTYNFTIGNLPVGLIASLDHNTANTSIDLVITAVPGFRWTGATSGDWDESTLNWINLQDNQVSKYSNGVPAIFLDGASTGNINLVFSPSPSMIAITNDSLPYIWNGATISTAKIRKYGDSSVTRITSGIGDNVGELELNEGTYVYNNSDEATFTTILTDVTPGLGTFTKAGANVMILQSTNSTFDGTIKIQEGTIRLATNGLGSINGPTIIENGATLDVNDVQSPNEPVFVSGAGVSGLGAIIDSTITGGVHHNLTDVTMVGDTTFGCPFDGRWDIRIRTASGVGPGLKGNGYNLTKVGNGGVSLACQRHFGTNQPYWDMNLGDVYINEGSITFAESLTLGNPSKTINVANGATMAMFDLGATNPLVRTINLTNATISSGGNPPHTNVLNGTINLDGACYILANQATTIINGSLAGSGSLGISANSPGKIFFNGVNTFPGDITVTNGTVGGYGVIAGNLTMLGGTNTPGMGVGTLTVNGNATLAGTTIMELNRSLSPNSDRLHVDGTLTWGGDLRVVFASGATPQAGDVYQLFNKVGDGGFNIILPSLIGYPPGDLAWDTNNFAVNGSISITGTPVSPTIGSVTASGGSITISGTGGAQGSSYVVLASTNVALPLVNWSPVLTNTFGAGGTFSSTLAIDTNAPVTFFSLQLP